MKTILIVEDDDKIATSLRIRLESAGYEVHVAHDGLEGLSAALRLKPDLIVLDVWMPGAVGFLMAERLKHFGLANIPVIFITASRKQDLWHMAREIGAAAFFEKPYDPDELLDAVASAVSPRRASPQRHCLTRANQTLNKRKRATNSHSRR